MRKIVFFTVSVFATAAMCMIQTAVAEAETHITSGYLSDNAVWNAAGSPYLIDDPVTIPHGRSLTIGPGTSVVGGQNIDGSTMITVQGNLNINGREDSRVNISGYGGIQIIQGTSTISFADFSNYDGISVFDGYATISDSVITNAGEGIHARSSKIGVERSRIFANRYGVFVESSNGGTQKLVQTTYKYGTGGIGNALEGITEYGSPILAEALAQASDITIHDSEVSGNFVTGIQNLDSSYVHATDNWWGSGDGPSFTGPNKIFGKVEYDPWKKSAELPNTPCCSSILFIPGIEGSRLYRADSLPFGWGTSSRQLWEPQFRTDISALYLNKYGSSTKTNIYSGQPIDIALGIQDVYGTFMKFLDDLAGKGTIASWQAFGYDWRKPISEVVGSPEKRAVGTQSLLDTVTAMASTSKTGKVTLVAHSNGGLVAKYLVKMLADIGKSNMIDSVISVAVPYLGTPAAIGAILHGDGQAMANGFILNTSQARGLALNMASAYSLLPSDIYFSKVMAPSVAFASSTEIGINAGQYPQNIRSGKDQKAFMTDVANVRKKALVNDTVTPLKANEYLSSAADALHAVLDSFNWPASIARWALIGWGKDTPTTLKYASQWTCSLGFFKERCTWDVNHSTETTSLGDGTVVAPSAAYDSGERVSIKLGDTTTTGLKSADHSNILAASSTERVIEAIVSNPAANNSKVAATISKVPGVALGEPNYSSEPNSIVVRTDCPVELNVYDSLGRHTGFIPKPSALKNSDAIEAAYETNIPGSSFSAVHSSDGGWNTTIRLPEDNGERYSVVMNGTGFGFFNGEIETYVKGVSKEKVRYAMEPVSPLMVATTTIGGNIATDSYVPIIAMTPTIHVDVDGDGRPDFEAVPGSGLPGNMALTSDETQIEAGAREIMANALQIVASTTASNVSNRSSINARFEHMKKLMKQKKLKDDPNGDNQRPWRYGHYKLREIAGTEKKSVYDYVDAMTVFVDRQ